MKILVIGSVQSTRTIIYSLKKHHFQDVDVFGYMPKDPRVISGYCNLEKEAAINDYNFYPFQKINDKADFIAQRHYDVIFVVGLSQLVSSNIINSARLITVGFHPTCLPRGRGRAPLAWLVLAEHMGAASLFQIRPGDGADCGPILVQEPFAIDEERDTARTVESKLLDALDRALDQWLPQLKSGIVNVVEQNDSLATEYGIRRQGDGWIDWKEPASRVSKQIRAAMPPHPGAFAFTDSTCFSIEFTDRPFETSVRGVAGRVLKVQNGEALIQTGDHAIWIKPSKPLAVGEQLGISSPFLLYNLIQRMADMETQLARLQRKIDEHE